MQLDDVLASLDFEQTGPSTFTTGGLHFPTATWTFGGLLVAQVMMAAARTAPDRSVRSCHVTFLSRSDPHRPIVFEVDRVDDRTTFAHRTVTGRQDGDARVIANVLLHREEPEGPRYQGPTAAGFRLDDATPIPHRFVLETMDASTPPLFSTTDTCDSEIAAWFRIPDLEGSRQLHEALLGFASDMYLLETGWRPVPGASITETGQVVSSTLTQTTWFHEPFQFDDWLLFRAESSKTGFGRSLCAGHWFDQTGRLVASCAQEGLMRMRGSRK